MLRINSKYQFQVSILSIDHQIPANKHSRIRNYLKIKKKKIGIVPINTIFHPLLPKPSNEVTNEIYHRELDRLSNRNYSWMFAACPIDLNGMVRRVAPIETSTRWKLQRSCGERVHYRKFRGRSQMI